MTQNLSINMILNVNISLQGKSMEITACVSYPCTKVCNVDSCARKVKNSLELKVYICICVVLCYFICSTVPDFTSASDGEKSTLDNVNNKIRYAVNNTL